MTNEKEKNLKTITTEELLGSLITLEHTVERDQKEKEIDKKKKKDLALQVLLDNDEEDTTLLTRRFKNFLKINR